MNSYLDQNPIGKMLIGQGINLAQCIDLRLQAFMKKGREGVATSKCWLSSTAHDMLLFATRSVYEKVSEQR